MREDGPGATIDLIRENTEMALSLRLEEVGFSGSRSPWGSGQYEFSDGGFVEFPVGQDRARVTLSMTSDRIREADQQSTLRKCRIPALVLCGAHDALCPVKRHSFMAELLADAKLVVLQDSGHLPPLEEPDFIPRLLEDEVLYDDEAPWPTEPDGTGLSLTRYPPAQWGHAAASWAACPRCDPLRMRKRVFSFLSRLSRSLGA